jgi:peptidyl-prolyl cis-trans isomerase SurA
MKKIILLLILPFMIKAQTPAENKNDTEKGAVITGDAKEEARKKIEGYRERVLNGESMSVIATLFTDDPGSAKTGGRYDNIARGQFVPEFEAVAFSMQPGDISKVFETDYGFHFVQLLARRGEVIDVRHVLVKWK